MRIKRTRAIIALVTTAVLGLSACGDDGGGGGGGGDESDATFNAALDAVFNPSEEKGGTLTFGQAGDWADSVDPGNTYYGYSWNFARLYSRALVTFAVAPGKGSEELVPDLAESLGEPSDDGKTWTYTLREGLKFEDGTPITSADVAYAVARSIDKTVLTLGPAYFDSMLNWPEGYKGPYKNPDADISSAIETPDERTIVFHLKQPFAGFDYLAQLPQTAPVPQAKDTGAKYKENIVSSGPYKFTTYDPGKEYVLERNDQWDPETDPIRPALPDRIVVQLGMNPDDVDNQVISGDIDVDVQGAGAQPAAITKVLQDENLKKWADNPTLARTWFVSIIPTVKPLDNIECRKAIMYGVDHVGFQTAFGGPIAGGELATSMLPPIIPGHDPSIDLYPNGEDNTGDLDAAKAALEACGQPDGFEINMGFRAERPKEEATAESFQESLARVGIKVNLKPLPEGTYFAETCGVPKWVVDNNVGLCSHGWGADWNDGFGFLSQIMDSRTIRDSGNYNLSVMIPEVDEMLDAAATELDAAKREEAWGAIDRRVMEEAVVYPGIYAKGVLLRSKNATNVFVSEAYQMYDYVAMGAGGE